MLDILLLLVDIFWCCCCWWCFHIKFLIESSLTLLGRRKLFSRCWLPFFGMFVYVLLKFDWLIFFFLENVPRKLKILNFFFLSSFSAQFFRCNDCAFSFLKSGRIFCPRGNFNWMGNDLYNHASPGFYIKLLNVYTTV